MSHPTEGDGCYGCWEVRGYRCSHESYFIDSRTGRRFCHECAAALITWELDGCPDPDEGGYPDWIDEDVALTPETPVG